jgi:hypothetical protein
VTRIDPGVVSLLAELRGHERRAAEELGQWKTHHEERKVMAKIYLTHRAIGRKLESWPPKSP